MGFDKSLSCVLSYTSLLHRLLEIKLHVGQAVAKAFTASEQKAGFSSGTALETIQVYTLEFSFSIRIIWTCLRMNNSTSEVWISCTYFLWGKDAHDFLFSEQKMR